MQEYAKVTIFTFICMVCSVIIDIIDEDKTVPVVVSVIVVIVLIGTIVLFVLYRKYKHKFKVSLVMCCNITHFVNETIYLFQKLIQLANINALLYLIFISLLCPILYFNTFCKML